MKAPRVPRSRAAGKLRLNAPTASPAAGSTHSRSLVCHILHAPRSQTKLTVGAPDDAFEREADQVADHVMRMPEPGVAAAAAPPRIQRPCAECEEEMEGQGTVQRLCAECEEEMQAKEEAGRTPEVPSGFAQRFAALHGQPLPASERAFFEPRFGRDFADVRLHSGPAASALAGSVHARAFTLGNAVVFGSGQYATGTRAGRTLLAHELTHVVQQQGNRPRLQRQPAPAVPPRLVRVEVEPGSRGHFPQIPSTGSGTHWVGAASTTAPKPIVRAVTDPSVPPSDPSLAGLSWSGPGVTPLSDPSRAEVERTAGRRLVTASLGGASASTTLWMVYATIRTTSGPTTFFDSDATRAVPGATIAFSATIHPASILTATNRPDLAGANDTAPPGGVHWTGDPLAGGADHHWDFSRKMRVNVVNPAALSSADFSHPGFNTERFLNHRPAAWPSAWEEGNDDRATGDENNNPYASAMTSSDRPHMPFVHTAGSDGDTFEIRMHFREFVRLELNRAWWVISHLFPWKLHQRIRKDHGRWIDDGTTAATDNAGF